MSKVLYAQSNGTVAVVTPATGVSTATIQSKVVPSGTASVVVADSIVPVDRTFRDAWELSGSTITVDLVKAKAIATANIRETAVAAAKISANQTALSETVTHVLATIYSAHGTAKAAIAGAANVATVKTLMDTFINTYS
tara:strand:+ start:422 stop:838 length:417 start_codon:yes stop_codon:yes gene_type:complete